MNLKKSASDFQPEQEKEWVNSRLFIPSAYLFCAYTASVNFSFFIFVGKTYFGFFVFFSLLSILLLFITIRKQSLNKSGLVIQVLFLFAVITIPFLNRTESINPETISFQRGTVLSVEKHRYNSKVSVINDNKNKCAVFVPSEISINPGDTYIFSGKLSKISSSRIDLFAENYDLVYYYNDNDIIINRIPSYRIRIKKRIESAIQNLYTPRTASVLKALLLGNQNSVSKETIRNFTRAGTLHLLAASGLHVGIAGALPLFILPFIFRNRKAAIAGGAIFILLFLLITDMPVSLVRASVMFFFSAFFIILDRKNISVNSLFLSGLIIGIISPREIFSLGFQLSFLATLGIIIFYEYYKAIFSNLKLLSSSLAMTFAAQVFIFPLIILKLNQVNFTGILSNIILVPYYSFLLIASGVSVIASFLFTYSGKLLSIPVEYLTDYSIRIVNSLSSLNGHFRTNNYQIILITLFILPLIPFFFKKFKLHKIIPIIIILISQLSMFIILSSQKVKKYENGGVCGSITIQREND
ncbi:MAG TPA: ComEC/Rec2 family competence protein, partial [Spirochaetota bacterium]|nr:ComEC/Rec2 family competence protein [Spirochaetota bacterium]